MKKLFVFISVFLSACRADRSVEVFDANGLEYGENRNALVFITPKLGIAGGNVNVDTAGFDSPMSMHGAGFSSVIWRTVDEGRSWTQTTIRDSSSIDGLADDGKNIYAVIHEGSGDRGSVIMRSLNAGKSWSVLCERPDVMIRGLYVRDSTHFYYRDDYARMSASVDAGKTWTSYSPISGVEHIFYDGSTAYFLSSIYDTSSPCRLVGVDLDTGESTEIVLPPGRRGSTASRGNMLFLLRENVVELYRIHDRSVSLVAEFDPPGEVWYTPRFIYYHDEKIYLYMAVDNDWLSTRSPERLMFSGDGGASWERIRLGWDRIFPFDECTSALPVGETFNLYYLSDPLQIGVIRK